MSQACWAARLQKSFPLYKAVPLGPAEAMAAQVQGWQAEGIARFQLKLGADPHEDATRVRAVARVLDDGALIVADANGGWRLADAMVAARLLEPLDRVIFEEPCKTLEECLHVRRHTSLPMVLDEVITDVPALLRANAAGGMEGINLKLSKFAGLTDSKLVRDLCDQLGLKVTIKDSWGGDLVIAAVAHLTASDSRPQAAEFPHLYRISFPARRRHPPGQPAARRGEKGGRDGEAYSRRGTRGLRVADRRGHRRAGRLHGHRRRSL